MVGLIVALLAPIEIDVQATPIATVIGTEEIATLPLRRGVDAIQFQIPGVRMSGPPSSSMTGISEATNYCIDGGAPADIGYKITNEIERIEVLTGGAIYSDVRTVDPTNNLRGGGLVVRTYGVNRIETGARLNVYSMPGRNLMKTFDIPLSTYRQAPANPLIREEFYPDNSNTDWSLGYQKFGGLKFGATYKKQMSSEGLLLPIYNKRVGKTITNLGYGIEYRKQFGESYVDGLIKESGRSGKEIYQLLDDVAPQGQNMNHLYFPGSLKLTATPNCGSEVAAPIGTMWVPNKSMYQIILSLEELTYRFSDLVNPPPLTQVRFRTNCLDMGSKEPQDGVKYFPFATSDAPLLGIANIAARSNIRGPWDQARTWIYTDRASFSQINKRLLPGIPSGLYTQGLYDVTRSSGFGIKDFDNKSLFDASLFSGSAVSENGLSFFTSIMSDRHPKETRSYFDSNPGDFTKLLTGNTRDMDHAARTMGGLLTSTNSDVRLGALKYLSLNPSNVFVGKIGSLRYSLYSKDSSENSLALGAVERFVPERPNDALKYLSVYGKTDAIKQKAASLVGN